MTRRRQMADLIKIDPMEHPRVSGESWWVVHPNSGGSQFCIPRDAVTACTEDFRGFSAGTIYRVWAGEMGWVKVKGHESVYEMPEYVFARYFDAEAFVVGSAAPQELEKAKPFDYKPTLPPKEKKQLELFNDTPNNIPGGLAE
jgi:hypothetical protein